MLFLVRRQKVFLSSKTLTLYSGGQTPSPVTMGEAEGSKKMQMEERESVSLDDLKTKMADFAKERDWDQFHTPRNLLLALVIL